MKSNLIKFGSVCIISTLLLTACVKKEEPVQEESKAETTQSAPAVQNQPAEVELTSLDDVTENTVEQNNVTPTPNTVQDAPQENTRTAPQPESNTATTPTPAPAKPEQKPVTSAPVEKAKETTAPAQAAQETNSAASVDDAVAQAMKAAQPAMQQ